MIVLLRNRWDYVTGVNQSIVPRAGLHDNNAAIWRSRFLTAPHLFCAGSDHVCPVGGGRGVYGVMCVDLGRSRNRLFQFEEEFVYKGDVYYVSENQEKDIGIF